MTSDAEKGSSVVHAKNGPDNAKIPVGALDIVWKPQVDYRTTSVAEGHSQGESGFIWTKEEERRVVWKIDVLVMGLLMMGCFALTLDKSNIAYAKNDTFEHDTGITQSQFNTGSGMMFLALVIFEIPSNFVLYRVGPTWWIGGQFIGWGLIATFQAFQHGFPAFAITRFLLGTFESGFTPAALYTITRWYKEDETSKRFSWYYVGGMIAYAFGGLIAYGILHIQGFCGLAGWQWIFLIEGIATIVLAVIFLFFLPKSTENPTSILGLKYFSERECHILARRTLNDPGQAARPVNITVAEFAKVATNWKLIAHIGVSICALAPIAALSAYGPELIKSFGFGRLQSNAMHSVGTWIQVVTTLTWGFLADKWGHRGPMVFSGLLIYCGFMLGDRLVIYSNHKTKRYILKIFTSAFCMNWNPVNASWMALNAPTPGQRSVTLAIFSMAQNLTGVFGAQIFQQSDDKPFYPKAWAAMLGLVSAAVLFSAAANAQYHLLNRRKGPDEWKYKY